jgi:hypothetical protein
MTQSHPAPAETIREALDPVELAAFRVWKAQRDEEQRKRGAYWLTAEGRTELRSIFEGDNVLALAEQLIEAAIDSDASGRPDGALYQHAIALRAALTAAQEGKQ